MRGEEVPAIPRHVPKGRPVRMDEPLYQLALDRGYRVQRAGRDRTTAKRLYRLTDRRDRFVRDPEPSASAMAWLEKQQPIQW